jgi:hypothetical protein
VKAPDAFLAAFDRLDAALVSVPREPPWPATSPWWRAELERYLRSGRRRWVIRAGRRAGKSSFLCRLACVVALWGRWSVPAGDTAVIAFVSVDRDEASRRLRTVRDILTDLAIDFDERGDEIELRDRRVVFRVVTCSVRGTVGFTSVMVVGDEMAKWESRDDKANPAREVMASLRPTMATQREAFEVCSSSPWGSDDYHAELFDQGETQHQAVSFAPTWIANPSITEAMTHELEPDEQIRLREYGAIPGATISDAFDPADVLAAFKAENAKLRVGEIGGWDGAELRSQTMEGIVRTIAARARKWGAPRVFGDQREEASLQSLFAQQSVGFVHYAWSLASKDAAVQLLRRLMRERQIFLPEHERLRRELLRLKARLTPSGATQYMTNGLDYASALITLGHAAVDNKVRGGFVAIDASSLRGDSFAYLCGNGTIGERRQRDLTVGHVASDRTGFGNAYRDPPRRTFDSYEERRAAFWRDER